MKICVLGTRGFPGVQGGVETHCENLYPRIASLGCKVIVFVRPDYVDPKISEYRGVKLFPIASPRNKFLEAFIHTFKGVYAARREGCDILHIHAIGPSFFVPLARWLGLRVVVTNHGPDYDRQKWGVLAKLFLRFGERLGTLKANAVIAISRTIATHLQNKFGREAIVIPNGVIMPLETDTIRGLSKYGLRKGKYLLAVGRFVPEKGFHDLIDAFCSFDSDWMLVIAGGADHEDEYSRGLKAKAAKNKNIVLTGFLKGEPLHELFAHAGVFVLPSYHEGLPIVLLEAMSYGLSCVLSDIPANREVALDHDRYFKAGDLSGLSRKLKDYMDRGTLSDVEKQSQLFLIRRKYDWDDIAQQTLEVYRKIL